ncbi:hypothetical protein [Pseudoalteromonas sp. NBT06-2]|uniref:hypothetical protein n=1 Tax=Pseudoalteromonas sp. NBT06-2 TaxID=2025950 RepID=UPI0020760885|nr:hypothetical protein [Pseudoalteromonas sp. NBT06-2]
MTKTCPVIFKNQNVGILAFSIPWFHNSGSQASYIAKDSATGIGIEIHFLVNDKGLKVIKKSKLCDQYRMIQFRDTNAKLPLGQNKIQLDIPTQNPEPFYDSLPLEFGHGMHKTPIDTRDKPWTFTAMRASTVAIYDTPFVSDNYGIEGKDIEVKFETCVVCQKFKTVDRILSCGSWGFNREYMGDTTSWSEPVVYPIKCSIKPNKVYLKALDNTQNISYRYGLDWR